MATEYVFKVLCGSFRTVDGRTFDKGEQFQTPTPLHEKFPAAFQLVQTFADPSEVATPEFSCAFAARKGRRGLSLIVNTQTGRVLSASPMESPGISAVVDYDFKSFFAPPPLFKGITTFILGGGPSLKGMDLTGIQEDYKVIGVNDAYQFGDWVDVCFFSDFQWLNVHAGQLSKWPGMKITHCPDAVGRKGIFVMDRSEKSFGKPNQLPCFKNSGTDAICLAIMLGATRIVLLGFDLKLGEGGKSNWHDKNISANTERTYKQFIYHNEQLALRLKKDFPNVEVLNATPGSALTVFPTTTLEDVLRGD